MHPLRMRVIATMLAAVGTTGSGCALAGHTSSPWEFGGGIRVAPGFAAGTSGVSVHPMASATYLSFDGGHDELYELGGQIRKSLPTASGLWIGAEAAVATLRTKGDTFSESTNGWSLTGLVGAPVGKSKWGVNLYAGAGISNYGSSGKNVRVGVDLQPWFLKR